MKGERIMSEKLVEIKDVTKSFKGNMVVEHISIDFLKGKSYGLIGPNGSGKSVFLKLLCGFSKPDSGEIKVNNKVIGKDVDFIENAGISINAPEFVQSLSGLENLQMLAGIRKKISKDEITKLAEQMELSSEDLRKKVKNYSLGMKQKLRIIQAVMEEPSILVLDEPMNALDKSSVGLVKKILRRHIEKGGTLFFTSHNREDVGSLADEVYEMEKGKLVKAEQY